MLTQLTLHAQVSTAAWHEEPRPRGLIPHLESWHLPSNFVFWEYSSFHAVFHQTHSFLFVPLSMRSDMTVSVTVSFFSSHSINVSKMYGEHQPISPAAGVSASEVKGM